MSAPASFDDLTAHLLIAMPGMGDPRFAHSVVLLCEHSPGGSMGLIVNKPLPDLTLEDVLQALGMDTAGTAPDVPVGFGGPVDRQRGFVLHPPGYRGRQGDALDVAGRFGLSATRDVLEDMGKGAGPDRAFFALGYAGWGPGQLEDEIVDNGWLTCAATETLVFDLPLSERWSAALAMLGADPLSLSSVAGSA